MVTLQQVPPGPVTQPRGVLGRPHDVREQHRREEPARCQPMRHAHSLFSFGVWRDRSADSAGPRRGMPCAGVHIPPPRRMTAGVGRSEAPPDVIPRPLPGPAAAGHSRPKGPPRVRASQGGFAHVDRPEHHGRRPHRVPERLHLRRRRPASPPCRRSWTRPTCSPTPSGWSRRPGHRRRHGDVRADHLRRGLPRAQHPPVRDPQGRRRRQRFREGLLGRRYRRRARARGGRHRD